MTLEQLLGLGRDLADVPDDELTSHLAKYFLQTRPITEAAGNPVGKINAAYVPSPAMQALLDLAKNPSKLSEETAKIKFKK